MKKIVALAVFIALVILLGPRFVEMVTDMFKEKYDVSGTWQISYYFVEDKHQGTFEFRPGKSRAKGVVWSEGVEVGEFQVDGRVVEFSIDFGEIAENKFKGVFTGRAYTQDLQERMAGSFQGTRTVIGINTETEGDWEGFKI